MLKKLLFLLSVILVITLYPTTAINVNASTYSNIVIGDFTYFISSYGKTARIKDYHGNDSNAIIPSTVEYNGESYTVVDISGPAFYGCRNLEYLYIPKEVINIEASSFSGCSNLSEIEIHSDNPYYSALDGTIYNKNFTKIILCQVPIYEYTVLDGVTCIGEYAFSSNDNIKIINIPASVNIIEKNSITYLNSLSEFNVSAENISYSSVEGVLFDKSLTTLISYPAGNIRLKYEIPNTVNVIDENAFQRNDLEELNIPSSVSVIGDGAFINGLNMKNFFVENDNMNFQSKDGVIFSKDLTTLIAFPANKVPPTYHIPEGVTTIYDDAFWNSKITSINLPKSLKHIKGSAFVGTHNLDSIVIPENVETIDLNNFLECTKLKSITFLGRPFQPTSELSYIIFLSRVNPKCYISVPDEFYDEYVNLLTYNIPSGIQIYKASQVEQMNTTHTVTFDTQGGSLIAPITVASGSTITLPVPPTKPNYMFGGWYKSTEFSSPFNTDLPLTSDLTLYAKWKYYNRYSSSTPSIEDTNNTSGWNSIIYDINNATEGDTLNIDLNGTTVLPKSVLEKLIGKDITLELNFDTHNWIINGKNITNVSKDISFGVRIYKAPIIDPMLSNKYPLLDKYHNKLELDLEHNGDFPTEVNLSVKLGANNEGKNANLYYYNELTDELEYQESSLIAADGFVSFSFNHASRYFVVITDKPLKSLEEEKVLPTIKKKLTIYQGNKFDLKKHINNLADDAVVTFTSNKKKIASVNKSSGKLKVKKTGKSTISIQVKQDDHTYKLSTVITVKKPYVKITKSAAKVKKGKGFTFSAKRFGLSKNIIWSVSNKKIATINKKSGELKALNKGKVKVTATCGNIKISKKVTVY